MAIYDYREIPREVIHQQAAYYGFFAGAQHQADCWLRCEPLSGDQPWEFVSEVDHPDVPWIKEAVAELAKEGVLAGYPWHSLRITCTQITDTHHASKRAYKLALANWQEHALPRADWALLEPVFRVTVLVPTQYLGPLVAELNLRHGIIEGLEDVEDDKEVEATIPWLYLQDFEKTLDELSAGTGVYGQEFRRYTEAPEGTAKKVSKL